MHKSSLNDIVGVQPMMTGSGHSLNYHVETPEEAVKRKTDTTWHFIHCFVRGYGWLRNSDNIYVSCYSLIKSGIDPDGFPKLPIEKIDEIVNKIKEDNQKERKFREANPIKPFDAIAFPKFSDSELNLIRNSKGPSISETFSSTYLDDLGNQDVKES
jgi:hypothetical protein